MSSRTTRWRRAAGALAVAGSIGCGALAVGHAGVEVPLVSALGPGGSRPVWPAAIAFSLATVAYVTVAVGLRRGAAWATWAGTALFAATAVGALRPAPGAVGVNVVAGLIGVAGAGLLLADRATRSEGAAQGRSA